MVIFLNRNIEGGAPDGIVRNFLGPAGRQSLEMKVASDARRQHIHAAERRARRFERGAELRDDAIVEASASGIGDECQDVIHGGERALKPAVIIAGPTASGKSGCALAAAEEFGGVVINADAMQLYKEFSILTDRPDAADLARAPHRLYGVLAASDPCSAGRWRELALSEMAAEAGRLPILVGGTGLYLKALISGLSPVPPIPAAVRAEARALYDRLGKDGFRAEVLRRDSERAEPPHDKQRLLRVYEVLTATGRPLREWQAMAAGGADAPFRYACILFDPPREDLYAAIECRFERMVEAGAVEEVRRVLELRLDPSLPAMKALGLKELAAHVRGEIGLPEAVAKAKQASRNYAKRQVTWFRHQFPAGLRLNAQFSESLSSGIFSFIRGFC